MNILYHIRNPKGLGADRWIYEGWRDAFFAKGHCFNMTTDLDIRKNSMELIPDILMTDMCMINYESDIQYIELLRKGGTKVFLWIHWPPSEGHEEWKEILVNKNIADVYFGEREPEGMGDFEIVTKKKYHCIPNAANQSLHFPTEKKEKYEFDIVYLGAYLKRKKKFFNEVLIPLSKKYSIGIFGPYWTYTDKFFAGIQKYSRKLGIHAFADFINKRRISIPADEENVLYSSAKISINVHEWELDGSFQHIILNQRTFKIPACGGFEICDDVPYLRRYFTADEVVSASSPADWFEKISHYLKHSDERVRIQWAGTKKALKYHTYSNRVDRIIELYQHCKD